MSLILLNVRPHDLQYKRPSLLFGYPSHKLYAGAYECWETSFDLEAVFASRGLGVLFDWKPIHHRSVKATGAIVDVGHVDYR